MGRVPRAQLARSLPRRIAAVASGHACSEWRRPIAAGTKTSSVRSIAARSLGESVVFASATDADQPKRTTATTNATAVRRTARH